MCRCKARVSFFTALFLILPAIWIHAWKRLGATNMTAEQQYDPTIASIMSYPPLLPLPELKDAAAADVRPGLHLDGGVLAALAQLLDLHVQAQLASQFRPSGRELKPLKISAKGSK